MLPTTLFSLPNQQIITNLHNSRKLLTPLFHEPQTTLAPTPNDQLNLATSANHTHNSFDTNLVMVLSVLICAVICSLCINSVIKCVLKCSAILSREPNYYLDMMNNQKVGSGVDKRALKRFPVVKYSKERNIQGLGTDCVICLSEFKEGEKVRLLPKCNHGFHVKCIDKWLGTHSSCPTCRQSLVDTCQKIIGCDQEQHQASLSGSSVGITGELITVSIVPLQRENMVRDQRRRAADDQC